MPQIPQRKQPIKVVIPKTGLRAPFPWFGGKSTIARIVWARFGDVRNYVEPFFGSGAVLLGRPDFHQRPIETVNDLDGMVSNFWRALQAAPDEVAKWADWPVNECDLHARHLWLVNEGRKHVERLKTDADYFDAKIAGWWVWGCCQWIGSGWCEHPEWKQLPHLGSAGMGIHRPSQQLPHLGNSGMGIHRPSQKRPHLGNSGMGIHRPSQKRPHLGNAGMGNTPAPGQRGYGHPPALSLDLHEYFHALAARLARVRVCCGDWSRVCGPTPTVKQGLTGVFLDPPYTQTERDAELYAIETNVAADVRKWCVANGNDKRLRIALCGYEGEGHEELEARGWEVHAWKAKGGYGSQGTDTEGKDNARRERIWFSPHCNNDAVPALLEEMPREPAQPLTVGKYRLGGQA